MKASGLKLDLKSGEESTAGTELDPVCGMRVVPERAAARYEYKGTTYYFCSPGCLAKFRVDPERYLAAGAAREPMAHGMPASAPAARPQASPTHHVTYM